MKRKAIAAVLVVLACLAIGGIAIVGIAEAPHILSPAPFTFLIPAFTIEPFLPLGADGVFWVPILAMAAFAVSAVPIMVRGGSPPVLSFLLYCVASALSLAYFIYAWEDGTQRQGFSYTLFLAGINALFVGGLFYFLVVIGRRSTPARAWSFHFLLFLWLSWFAFPWLGEMP